MKTLDLHAATDLLKLHPSTVLAKARAGEIPAAKPGKCWVFIEDDLIAYLRGLYTSPRQDASEEPKQEAAWSRSLKEPAQITGITSFRLTEKQYTDLLEPPKKDKRKKSPTAPALKPTTSPYLAKSRATSGKTR
ncbi:helix-turn-helix domain-containing protein [Methylomonas sp. MED-D]|uniref:helix-turn-helix domain-containing protein n=1 Tax=Methylomonas sp. MED-D TaxID=3418768 RepID=UPI003D08BDDE